ncbi:uncharacterized protein [Zea mays]|nr:uncharacterized protein LOC100276819 isoform X2 [Zea mays]
MEDHYDDVVARVQSFDEFYHAIFELIEMFCEERGQLQYRLAEKKALEEAYNVGRQGDEGGVRGDEQGGGEGGQLQGGEGEPGAWRAAVRRPGVRAAGQEDPAGPGLAVRRRRRAPRHLRLRRLPHQVQEAVSLAVTVSVDQERVLMCIMRLICTRTCSG